MKKSYKKLLIFNTFLLVILLLNNFISNILNYVNLVVLLVALIIFFKYIFGLEKDNHRYIRDICLNVTIILFIFFIVYYLIGLLIGFTRTTNYYNFNGLAYFIIPYIIFVILKEYLRYQMLNKSGDSKTLIIITCITFILLDITGTIRINAWSSYYDVFMFIAITLLPSISRNITCTYISKKVGYKPNIIWLLVIGLYSSLLPIVPNVGVYLASVINFLFPVAMLYDTYSFYQKRAKNIPLRNKSKNDYIALTIVVVVVTFTVYFTSGYFKYYAITVATGSMMPNIYIGDVVLINQKCNLDDLKVGQVIAYKYESKIIVHRLVEIEKVGNDTYFYTKGDANNAKDAYIIYEDMILGVVNIRVPYIGLPTVWLNES